MPATPAHASSALPEYLEALGDGVFAVDTGFQRERFDAAYLLVQGGRAAFIDTGTHHAVPRLLGALAALGLARSAVDYVIPTHVHLDHAGGAGQLMARFPNARLTVHPRGARHMIDPQRLIDATVAIYGVAEMRRVYGEILPVPRERVLETAEGTMLVLAGRELRFFDAPGHARHHVMLRDGATGHIFCGDSFGLSYRELDRDGRQFVFPTTSPSQFEPQALHRTIDRMLSLAPQALYLTHFGRLERPAALAADLHRLIDAHVALGERHGDAGAERKRLLREGVTAIVLAERERQGWHLSREETLDLFALDVELNAQGLESWFDAERAQREESRKSL